MLAARRVIVCSVTQLLVLAMGCGRARPAGGAPPAAAAKPAPSASASPGAPGVATSLHWAGKLGASRTMSIHTVMGTIRAVAATDDQAVIDATLTPTSTSDPRTTLRVREDDEGVSLRTESRDEGCGCDEHGHGAPKVDVVVRVPAGVRLVVHTVEARVDADGVKGPVDLHTVDGAIEARGVTSAQVRTVNGPIKVAFALPDLTEDTEVSTVNGPVDITFPATANAELAAQTLNGLVHLDLPPAGPLDSHGLRMTLGHGGRSLRLRTVNGTISVKRAG